MSGICGSGEYQEQCGYDGCQPQTDGYVAHGGAHLRLRSRPEAYQEIRTASSESPTIAK